ncbi:MAG: cytochrome c [Candidatus Rokubacteria bacterium]|nr:cytochrome c [Candidatus Rokubacteria bacterium]
MFPMLPRWLLVPAAIGVILVNAAVFAAFWPPPAPPPNASRAQRAYFAYCARCHGVEGQGTWRVTLLLIRPGDLSDTRRMQGLSDQYLFDFIKNGGASFGKPGMPAFGFYLSDPEIQDLVRFLRALPANQ